MAALEAHEAITVRQPSKPLGIRVFLVGEHLTALVRQERETGVGEARESACSIEDESRVEEDTHVANHGQPIGARDFEIRQAVQLVCLTGCQRQTTGVHEIADRRR